jgi:hypothetical protein
MAATWAKKKSKLVACHQRFTAKVQTANGNMAMAGRSQSE